MTVETAAQPARWELRYITKVFPGVRANDGISISLHAGEIHGLLGENGCGKSTLIKILSGVQQPDSGELRHDGRPVTMATPAAARAQGVATVYQEFSLIGHLAVAENISMGRHPRRAGGLLVDWAAVDRTARAILADLGLDIDPATRVGELSVAEQQLVEIAKALSQDATLLILDEPTTALGQQEITLLHGLLRRLKSRGVSILYITHRLDEVVELVDSFTVLKDGKVVSASGETRLDVGEIVARMVGQEVADHYPKERNATGEVVLEVRDLRTATRVQGASFQLHRGEVLGLGGVVGSGRTEIARAIFGADPITGGELLVDGKPLKVKGPADAIRAGIALVPENRKYDGLFFNFAAGPNITMANLPAMRRGPLFDHGRERATAARYVKDLEIAPLAQSKTVNLISGGNQQKVLIAGWLFTGSRIVILDEPTQGIDIGAKLAVYRLINELTRAGNAVILISSDHNELLAMSDRIAIVKHGRVAAVRPAGRVTHTDLVSAAEAPHQHPETEPAPSVPVSTGESR
ncbi:MAG TPA: sugar ABC transporter ATP-binding protein [Nakamurella sp.]